MANRLTDKTILSFALWLIILKPIFDLDWRWPLFYVGSIAIPFHWIVAFTVPAILTVFLSLRLISKRAIQLNNNIFAVIFLFSITITLIFQKDIYSIDEYIRTYSFFIIFLSLPSLITSEREFYRTAKLLVSIFLIPTFLSYLQTFGFLPFTYWDVLPIIGQIGRVSGGYRHPTGYLNYLVILIPLIIYLYANRIVSKKFFWFWILFTLPMVGRSLHRATIIIVFLQLAIFIFLLRRIWFKYFIIAIFAILLFFLFPYIWGLINQGEAISGMKFRGRSEIWLEYAEHFQNSNFVQRIIGFGSPKLPNGSYEAHSDWLRIAFNYGYFGLITYIAFLCSIFWILFSKLLRVKRKFRVQSEALIGLVLFSTIVLYSITMEPLRYSSFSWNCALVLGYAYMMILNPKKIRLLKK